MVWPEIKALISPVIVIKVVKVVIFLAGGKMGIALCQG
jgi:hypothetical protein